MSESGSGAANWQLWAGALVAIGMLATAGYAIVETFWG